VTAHKPGSTENVSLECSQETAQEFRTQCSPGFDTRDQASVATAGRPGPRAQSADQVLAPVDGCGCRVCGLGEHTLSLGGGPWDPQIVSDMRSPEDVCIKEKGRGTSATIYTGSEIASRPIM
jgi:hypothetical protein